MAKKGANKKKCQAYRDAKVRDSNKRKKLVKHLKKHSGDKTADKALKILV